MLIRSTCLTLPLLMILAGAAIAQDAHYWNTQYGNRAYMLGGAVIGSSDDVSAVYYNPALLTVSANPNLTVAGNAFYSTSVTLRNALGAQLDIESSSIGAVPTLVAGEIPLGAGGDHRLAYSLLFRQDFDYILERRGPISVESLPDSTLVRTGFEESGSEIWSGLSYAHRVGETLSVGVSAYLSYRTHRSRRETFVAAETAEEFAFFASRNDYDYTHIGLLAKVGVGGRTGGLHYGMTLTTPRLRLSGSGSRAFDRVLTGGAIDGSDLVVITDTDVQGNLQSTYHSPLSLGVGLAYEFARTGIHLAAEWFDDVSPYRLLDADRVLDTDTGQPIDLDLTTSSVSVVNVGMGLEHRFGDRVHGYVGFHTDRSAAGTGNLQQQLAVWDIYHASVGASLRLGATRVALGAVYAFGDEPLTGEIRLAPEQSDELPQDIEASYRSFLLLLGFDVDY